MNIEPRSTVPTLLLEQYSSERSSRIIQVAVDRVLWFILSLASFIAPIGHDLELVAPVLIATALFFTTYHSSYRYHLQRRMLEKAIANLDPENTDYYIHSHADREIMPSPISRFSRYESFIWLGVIIYILGIRYMASSGILA